MRNPFIYNSPVLRNDFCDRQEILETLIKEVITGRTQGDVWLTGERKVGKTSLLKYIYQNKQELIPDKFVDIYEANKQLKPIFAFANVQYCRSEKEFYNELWQSIINELDIKHETGYDSDTNFKKAIDAALETEHYFIFLIDEFDAFLETLAIKDPISVRNFINKLNSYLFNFPKYNHKVFSCIFTSNQDIVDLDKKYDLQITASGLDVKTYDLEWFSKSDVIQLTKKYLQDSDVIFSEKEITTLYKYTKGYPYFTQRLLHLMFKYKNKEQVEEIDELAIQTLAQSEYEKTIKFWTGQNMPKRTYDKLYDIIKNVGDKTFKIAEKLLVEYSKTQFSQ